MFVLSLLVQPSRRYTHLHCHALIVQIMFPPVPTHPIIAPPVSLLLSVLSGMGLVGRVLYLQALSSRDHIVTSPASARMQESRGVGGGGHEDNV